MRIQLKSHCYSSKFDLQCMRQGQCSDYMHLSELSRGFGDLDIALGSKTDAFGLVREISEDPATHASNISHNICAG